LKISVSSFDHREPADLLIVPFWEGVLHEKDFFDFRSFFATGDFKGAHGETDFLYREENSHHKEPRLLLLGLGKEEKGSLELLRRAYACAARAALAKKGKSVSVLLPSSTKFSGEDVLAAAAEGLFLSNYAFTRLKGTSLKDNPSVLFETISFIDVDPKHLTLLKKVQTIAHGVEFVRDLVNSNADDKTAAVLANMAMDLAKKYPRIETTILDKKKLEQENLNLILAVNRGSSHDPCLIIASYKGDPQAKEHVVLVGKGITYDTGGLNIKVGDGMLTMKLDMAGGATVLGVVQTAAALGLKVNVTAVIPAAENCIDAKSYKPGDVYRSYLGKTVEVTNTDAEGRLVLADALSYAVKNLHPTCLIDLASLTGAIVIALGEDISGLFTDNEDLCKGLLHASAKSGELLWRMPIHGDYLDSMKSEIADLVNSSASRDAGAIKGALFLKEFVGDIPWAHIDFAGNCYLSKPKHYNPTKGTGFGVRFLIEFLEGRSRH
jgi:leucyl aminopeptidase